MRKFTAILLALVLSVSLAACSGPASDGGNGENGQAPDLGGEVAGEITVSSYDTMTYKSFLEDAARRFEEKYPGTKVNVETFSAMPEVKTAESGDGKTTAMVTLEDDPQGRADYINKVGASLMSGSGADVYAMDVLPFYKYAESGQLLDLSAYMDADSDFNISDYRKNIFDAVKWGGGTWYLPLDYTFNYYAYDSTLLSEDAARFGPDGKFSLGDLMDLGKDAYTSGSEAVNLFNVSDYTPRGSNLFTRLFEDSYADFVDVENKKANFTDGAFVDLLASVKEYSSLGYVREGFTGQAGGAQGGPDDFFQAGTEQGGPGGMETPADRYFFKEKDQFSLQNFYNQDSGRRMNVMFTTGSGAAANEEDDLIAGIQADANGRVPFTYTQAYGINADSQNKETAWAFLKFLLSEETQLSTFFQPNSLPVHNAARATKAEMVLSGAFMSTGGLGTAFRREAGGPEGEIQNGEAPNGEAPEMRTPGAELDQAQREVLQKYLDATEKMADQINSYTVRDTIIDDMLATEAQYFFEGSKTAAEVADALQNKAELYLNE